jgi:hypothetical protein
MEETNSLIEQRKAKLAALRAKGINPFANRFAPTEGCGPVHIWAGRFHAEFGAANADGHCDYGRCPGREYWWVS